MTLALDERRDDDEVFETDGFTFLVEKQLFGNTGNLKIDMTYFGFSVDAERMVPSGASCSTGSCSTGGCGH